MKGNSPKTSVKVFTTILICILVVLTIALIIQFTAILSKKNKQAKLETAYKQTQTKIQEYDELLDYINYRNGDYSEEFLSNYAREVLGWGKAGNKYYTAK